MEKRTVQSVIDGLRQMVESKTPISPEQWIDAAGFLQILKFEEQDRRLALEMVANRKKSELRKAVESNADADLEWKTTKEYEDWQRQEKLLQDVVEFGRIAKHEATIRSNKWG